MKSSLGPVGLDKMLVDQIGDVTITNDGATILKQLEVEHPAAKVLVELSDRQDKEVGDGTTSVVIVAAELLKRANELIKQKIHPTTVIGGYKSAMREAVKHIKKRLLVSKDQINDDIVQAAAKTSMSSKIIGSENSFFSKLVVDAMKLCERKNESTGKLTYAVNGVNIVKVRTYITRPRKSLEHQHSNTNQQPNTNQHPNTNQYRYTEEVNSRANSWTDTR